MAEETHYLILRKEENQKISDFPKIMRRLYGKDISIDADGIEKYGFDDVDFFIDFEDEKLYARAYGENKQKRNLISKLENTTGFVLDEV